MTYKVKIGSDGSYQLRNKTSDMTAQAYGLDGLCKVLTATNTISAEENGMTYFLSATTEFVTTLPAPFLGANYRFIVKSAPSGASYTVVTGASANIFKSIAFNGEAAGVGDSGAADDTITFVDGQALAGDYVNLISDGTSWFVSGFCKVAAGITFTQATT